MAHEFSERARFARRADVQCQPRGVPLLQGGIDHRVSSFAQIVVLGILCHADHCRPSETLIKPPPQRLLPGPVASRESFIDYRHTLAATQILRSDGATLRY